MNVSPSKTRISFLTCYRLVLLIAWLCCSCNSNHSRYSHPAYFDPVFRQADILNSANPAHSLVFIDSAFNAFSQPGIKDLYRKYAFKYTFFTQLNVQYPIALAYTDSMLWIIREHTQEKEFLDDYASALFSKGFVLVQLKDYVPAFECHYKARQVIEQTGDTCSLSSYSSMLGWVSYKQEKYLDAARYTIQAVNEMKRCGGKETFQSFKGLQSKLDDIGICYSRCGMPDSALYYFQYALNYLQQGISQYQAVKGSRPFIEMAKAVVNGNMGDVYYHKGDTATAARLYRNSIDTNIQRGYDAGDAQATLLKLAGLYITGSKPAAAQQSLEQLRSLLDTFPNREAELKWYRLQLDYFDKTAQPAGVYRYTKPYLVLRDSLDAVKKIPQVNVNEEYLHMKTRYDLVVLEKTNQRKSIYLLIILFFSILVVSVALLLWHSWRRSRQLNDRISRQNIQMQKALTALEQSQEENTRMLKVVAHDLRNPIGGMTTVAGMMLEHNNRPAEEITMLELIKTSGENSLELVNDLLQSNARSEELKKEPVDLRSLLQYCADLLHYKAEEKGQRIQLKAATIVLPVDRQKIWRVISNLIANAIKFSPAGAVINVTLQQRQDRVRIAVKDHGIGIPDSLKDKIFDLFTEAKRAGTAGEQPFGLGLAISKQIIEGHGGVIWFESDELHGTTFYVELPIRQA